MVAADLNAETARKTADDAASSAVRTLGIELDIADEGSVQAAIERCVAEFGCIDILVNCAGSPGPLGGPIETETAAFEQVMKVNVQGLFHTCKHALPHLVARKGNVVNIASVAGLTGGGPPTIGPLVGYTTSKHAVIGFTRSIAYRHGGEGVRANAVCPGSIITGMTSPLMEAREYVEGVNAATPLGRWGKPEEVAACVAFLASGDASFVSGDVLTIDGGFMASGGKVYPKFSALGG